MLAIPFMAITFGAKASTGLVLPMLISGDLFAVWYYKRHTRWENLRKVLPWAFVGVLVATFLGTKMPEQAFKQVMAFVILLSVIWLIYQDRKSKDQEIPRMTILGPVLGLAVGFTTMVGNLAGPFANLYFMSLRFPKMEFIGTGAWLFFVLNIFKVPLHIFAWGTINSESIWISLASIPFVYLGILLGLNLVKRIQEQTYRYFILVMTALGALIIWFK